MSFQYANGATNKTPPSPLPSEFKISASPGTDIWRKTPHTDSFDAPILYRLAKLSSFRKARVSISAEWKTLYDQGGLCLVLPQKQGSNKWVKTGIEVVNGSPHVGTVACDRWADWSLLPMTGTTATVEMEREVENGKPTSSLWIYVLEGVERRPIREVTWVFHDAEDTGDCWIGAYAAKPTKDEGDDSRALEVSFSHLLIETT